MSSGLTRLQSRFLRDPDHAAKLAQERPGQTLQATALVHEAYLRLVKPSDPAQSVNSFFQPALPG